MHVSTRVLIIDDDEDFRSSVKSFLENQDYQVFEAASGKAGLRAILNCRPDAIIVDVMMATDDDGYGVTYSLRNLDEYADFRHTPILMVSSIEESPDERFPMSPEVEMIRPDAYLTKPLDFTRFQTVLEKELGAVLAH
jgi:CheY-like chemotaxis protein